MARDRQRSKARQRARAAQEQKGGKSPRRRARTENAPETPDTPETLDTGLDDATVEESGLAGELDHNTGALDEAEMAEAGIAIPGPNEETPEELSAEEFADLEDEVEEFNRDMEIHRDMAHAPDELELPSDLVAEGSRGGGGGDAGQTAIDPDGVPHRPRKERGKFITFLRGCIDELRRVQWPDRPHVFQATAVVLGFCLVAGGFLGLMDAIWQPLINALL